jgi:hypothetical protein
LVASQEKSQTRQPKNLHKDDALTIFDCGSVWCVFCDNDVYPEMLCVAKVFPSFLADYNITQHIEN